MKNSKKYKTPQERTNAFAKFCFGNDCKKCPLFAQASVTEHLLKCSYLWLDMEAKEDDNGK